MTKTDRERRTRDTDVRCRVTEPEKARLEEAAELAGLSMSSWMRERLFRAAREEIAEEKRRDG